MSEMNELYSKAKPDMAAVVESLFDLSQSFLRKNGNFLPHGAVLSTASKVEYVAAAPESGNDRTNSTEILPLLHEGLRARAKQTPVRAIGVAENVTVTLPGNRPTKAIKVLFEHANGLTVALYLPFEKKLLRGYEFGSTFSIAAKPEVRAWMQSAA
jgi:hypothetical protein